MTVKLISLTTGAGQLAGCTAEELISYCARVSNPSNQDNFDTAAKLLGYCIRKKHWSIFEQASMTVEIVTSRAIAQQILRHRSFCFQEFSQRYAAVQAWIPYAARRQDTKNRQNSIDDLPEDQQQFFRDAQGQVWDCALQMYNQCLDRGFAKEVARFLLPSSAQTTLYMTGTVRSWIHYLEIRTGQETQLEHRQIAEQIQQIFQEQFPNIAAALGT